MRLCQYYRIASWLVWSSDPLGISCILFIFFRIHLVCHKTYLLIAYLKWICYWQKDHYPARFQGNSDDRGQINLQKWCKQFHHTYHQNHLYISWASSESPHQKCKYIFWILNTFLCPSWIEQTWPFTKAYCLDLYAFWARCLVSCFFSLRICLLPSFVCLPREYTLCQGCCWNQLSSFYVSSPRLLPVDQWCRQCLEVAHSSSCKSVEVAFEVRL